MAFQYENMELFTVAKPNLNVVMGLWCFDEKYQGNTNQCLYELQKKLQREARDDGCTVRVGAVFCDSQRPAVCARELKTIEELEYSILYADLYPLATMPKEKKMRRRPSVLQVFVMAMALLKERMEQAPDEEYHFYLLVESVALIRPDEEKKLQYLLQQMSEKVSLTVVRLDIPFGDKGDNIVNDVTHRLGKIKETLKQRSRTAIISWRDVGL